MMSPFHWGTPACIPLGQRWHKRVTADDASSTHRDLSWRVCMFWRSLDTSLWVQSHLHHDGAPENLLIDTVHFFSVSFSFSRYLSCCPLSLTCHGGVEDPVFLGLSWRICWRQLEYLHTSWVILISGSSVGVQRRWSHSNDHGGLLGLSWCCNFFTMLFGKLYVSILKAEEILLLTPSYVLKKSNLWWAWMRKAPLITPQFCQALHHLMIYYWILFLLETFILEYNSKKRELRFPGPPAMPLAFFKLILKINSPMEISS